MQQKIILFLKNESCGRSLALTIDELMASLSRVKPKGAAAILNQLHMKRFIKAVDFNQCCQLKSVCVFVTQSCSQTCASDPERWSQSRSGFSAQSSTFHRARSNRSSRSFSFHKTAQSNPAVVREQQTHVEQTNRLLVV